MMSRESFLLSLHSLKEYLKSDDSELNEVIEKAHMANQWFIPEFTKQAINAICDAFLDKENCDFWLKDYPVSVSPGKQIAIIMAGNVPLVGFHDLFCVLASGHKAMIKLSNSDTVLPKFVLKKWMELLPSLHAQIEFVEKLDGFDGVIATGSNNSSRYFEYYFRTYPHILRQNRNGVGVLTGEESLEDLKELGKDMFLYFGLGCRNVSKVFIPEEYDFSLFETAIEQWNYLANHNKYRNNLDYNYAIYMINKVPHIHLGHLILKEDDAIASRIGCVHYSYYQDTAELDRKLEEQRKEIQCLVSKNSIDGWDHVLPGQTQFPGLKQYADGIDTMQFLADL